jgi:2-methylcitrate dehydratase PrpD
MHAGQAAQTGARAGLLAKNGFLGIDNVMEVEYGGFLSTYVDGSRPEELTSELGTRWETLNVGFKMYPACGSSHTTISVLEDLLAANSFSADDVKGVTVHCSTATHKHVGWEYSPLSVTTAQMNLPYAAATTLLHGTVTVDDYTDAAIRDDAVVDLARRVVTVPEKEIDDGKMDRRHEVWLNVELKDGRSLSGEARDAPGSPRRPASSDRVVAKFMQLAGTALSLDQCEAIRDVVLNLDSQSSMKELTDLLSTSPTKASRKWIA